MLLNEWARKWGISAEAIRDLRQQIGVSIPTAPVHEVEGGESGVQAAVRLEASRKGIRLWRNNVGVLRDERGVPVRYGLCNESKAINQSIKSSDLIGIRPDGRFIAREIKAPGWKFQATPRELAQLKFILLVLSLGGDAAFCTGEGTL